MIDLSPEKLFVVLFVAMLVLGPGRLGEFARGLGRARAHLRRLSSGLPPEAIRLVRDPRSALLEALQEPREESQRADSPRADSPAARSRSEEVT